MKKNIYFLIILLCSISFIRVLFTLNEENIHISKNIDISAIVTKIKKDKEQPFSGSPEFRFTPPSGCSFPFF